MNAAVEPNWDLLPFEPVAFFDLDEGFDRKALKRKYNALIKKYKPEKFPEEFQRIRAAYETLDAELRYGQPRLTPKSVDTYQWTSDQPESSSATAEAREKSESIAERLSYEKPGDIYKKLSAKKNKSPFDYYSLAVLADVVGDDKLMFVKWILTGLKDHSLDPGLLTILCEYFKEDIDRGHLSSLLLTTSKMISNDRFYFVTENLWIQLLSKAGFAEFEKTLARCESNLKDYRVECRLTFYVFIIRRAMWSATKVWTDKAFGMIEELYNEIPDNLSYDVDVLYMLKEYLDDHKNIIGDDPVRLQIHKTMKAYFSLSEKEGDRAFIRTQTQLAGNGKGVLDAFPELDENCQKLFTPWNMIHHEVAERHQLDGVPDKKGLRQSVYDLCQDLDFSNQFSTFNLLQYHLLTKGPYILLLATPYALLWTWLGSGYVMGLATILAIALAVVGHFVLKPSSLFIKSLQRKVKRLYMKTWRSRFIQVLEATNADHEDLTGALIFVIQQKHEQLGLSNWLYEHVPEDIGLAFYALTTRYTK